MSAWGSLSTGPDATGADVPVGSHHDLLVGLPPTVAWKAVNAPKCFGSTYYDELALDWCSVPRRGIWTRSPELLQINKNPSGVDQSNQKV